MARTKSQHEIKAYQTNQLKRVCFHFFFKTFGIQTLHFGHFFVLFSHSDLWSLYRLVDLTLSSGDLKDNLLASELVVDRLERLELVVNDSRVLVVKDNLLELVATNLVSDALANNLAGEDKVLEDSVVNGSQSSGLRALLGGLRLAAGLGEDGALSDENNVTVRELLLELTGQSLLDLVDSGEKRRGNENDDSLLASADFKL